MTTNTKLRAALLGSGAILALAAGPAFADETQDLKAQIDQLQTRLDQLEKQTTVADAKTEAAPADAVVGGDFPGSFKLPGSDTSLAIHGYTKVDFQYDFNARIGDSFVQSSIPGNHNALSNTGPQVRVQARQSRINFETRTPSDYGQVGTYIEGDFYGTSPGGAGGNNTSNFRIRHAYGTVGNFLAGQTWSVFTDVIDGAETLDFFGPVGTIVARQAQVRYTVPVGKWQFIGGLENPAGQVGQVEDDVFTPGAPVSVGQGAPRTGANNVVDRAPDITAAVHYTDTWGHLQAAGVIRYFATDNGGASNNSLGATTSETADAIGGGALVGGTYNVGTVIGGAFAKDQVGFQGFVGNGINRYVDTSERQGDAINFITVGPTGAVTETIHTQTQYGGNIWLLHYWTDKLRSNFAFGIDEQDWLGLQVPVTTAGTQLTQVTSIHANLIWSPVKSVNLGVEYLFGSATHRNLASGAGIPGGSYGEASRMQVSAQYLF
ncbi:MAG TPA: DcaP family trimeric outer membrane transporter [Alphaproteobacteria bacterium]